MKKSLKKIKFFVFNHFLYIISLWEGRNPTDTERALAELERALAELERALAGMKGNFSEIERILEEIPIISRGAVKILLGTGLRPKQIKKQINACRAQTILEKIERIFAEIRVALFLN